MAKYTSKMGKRKRPEPDEEAAESLQQAWDPGSSLAASSQKRPEEAEMRGAKKRRRAAVQSASTRAMPPQHSTVARERDADGAERGRAVRVGDSGCGS